MKKITLYLFFILAALCSGCQQTETLEPDTAYREKTVVFANLKEGKTFDGVTLTKTLPLSVEYDIKLAEIKDATVYMKLNGVTIIPLAYSENGLYKPIHIFTIRAGSTYELFVTAQGKRLYAQTYVPYVPKIDEAHIVDGQYIQAKVEAKSREVYGLAWVIPGAKEFTYFGAAQDFQEITTPESGKDQSWVSLRTIDIPEQYQDNAYMRAATVKAFAFDIQYYNYFKTKSNSQQVTNSFTQGSGQTMWNIIGEDVIGLFIGTAEGSQFKPN